MGMVRICGCEVWEDSWVGKSHVWECLRRIRGGNGWVEFMGWKIGRTCGWELVIAAGLRLSSAVVGAGGSW